MEPNIGVLKTSVVDFATWLLPDPAIFSGDNWLIPTWLRFSKATSNHRSTFWILLVDPSTTARLIVTLMFIQNHCDSHHCHPLSYRAIFLYPLVYPFLNLNPLYIYIYHFIIYTYITYTYIYILYIFIFVFIHQFIKLYAILIASGLDLPRHPGRDLQRLRGDVGSPGRWRYAKSDPHRWALGHLGPSWAIFGVETHRDDLANFDISDEIWWNTIWWLKYDRIYLMIWVDFLLISPIDRMSVMNPQKMLTVT